ncbi:mitotic spindle assembly checkpoint protein MAD2B [Harpegnathos saltator]|uniref:Mitotic spindle assembly checkpoint protein MAD2B n=1 Tax=Harpegnathos saltator TaxID=610380 RepID=E2C532_HARSA|nr:mitotic spindle assembly checkpoint protein MAD2B [Harpegnathos saltator]XP_025162880.1 mitotic spindle assembly checkpoint protein MAD2B [Harpegnathos saltator]XP_025162881.1 mitotic spindle assembly checkpoint protein MAD2B [Harpegnathos saltator]EFN76940.1 Mitotic spindle assembly checkpoint protein MAD2B [Harpegnathos saltator]
MSQDKIVGTDILLEFLEMAFHHVLFFRKIYPKEIFVKRKIYGIVVYTSEHPELNEYFFNALNAIKELIKEDENSVKTINLTFYNANKLPIERFVFDIVKLQAELTEKDPYYLKTEEALRTICLKLSMCDTYLKPLPDGTTFSIEIQTYETAHIALSENPKCEDFPWVVKDDATEMVNKNLLPLKDIKTDCLNLQMYVIEDAENKS